MTTTPEKLIRPTLCQLCGQPMFYVGDDRHTAEVRVTVEADEGDQTFFAHVKCWNERMLKQVSTDECSQLRAQCDSLLAEQALRDRHIAELRAENERLRLREPEANF